MTLQEKAHACLLAMARNDPRAVELVMHLTARFVMSPKEVIENIRRLAEGGPPHA